MPLRVCVVGAGAIGSSTAMCILQQVPGVELTMVAERFSPQTTSNVAAGLWFPHALGDTPMHLIRRWGKMTWDYLRYLHDHDPLATGTQMLSGYMMNSANPGTGFDDVLLRFCEMTGQERQMFSTDLPHQHFVTSIMCEGAIYTHWMMGRLKALGAKLSSRKLTNLQELYDKYDVIVNCSGIGAAQLVSDDNMYVLRGQVVKVEAPWVKHFSVIEDGEYYVIPGQKSVTLGGTHQKNDWDLTPRKQDADDIIQGCCRLLPSLKTARVVGHAVGLRPCRNSVRLEQEIIRHNTRNIQVIHNYGHGGAGLTLHYGCAQDVVSMITERKAKL